MDKLDYRKRLRNIESGYNNLTGFITEGRQKRDYAQDHYHELVSLCDELVEKVEFDSKKTKATGGGSNIPVGQSEAFYAGLNGKCEDCEYTDELMDNVTNLEIKNEKLQEELNTRHTPKEERNEIKN